MSVLVFGNHPADMSDLLWLGFEDFFSAAEPVVDVMTATEIRLRDPLTGTRLILYGVFDFSSEAGLLGSLVHRVSLVSGAGQLLLDWSSLQARFADVMSYGATEALTASLLAGDDWIQGGAAADVLMGDVPQWHAMLSLPLALHWTGQLDLADDRSHAAGVVSHWVASPDPEGIGAWRSDIVVLDLRTLEEHWVSVGSSPVPQADARHPSLSGDGQRVAFESEDGTLAGLPAWPPRSQVYVRDLGSGALMLASTTAAGEPAAYGARLPMLSADGRLVVFESSSPDLPDGERGWTQVYLKDLDSGAVRLVSASATDEPGAGTSGLASLSADGRKVAFISQAANLVAGVGDGQRAWIYVKDLDSGAVSAVAPVAVEGSSWMPAADDPSLVQRYRPALSADGRHVAFASMDASLVPDDTNGQSDVFVQDVRTGAMTRVSVTDAGLQLDHYSDSPGISADGSVVSFMSMSQMLQSGAGAMVFPYYLKRVDSGEVMLANPVDPAAPYNWPIAFSLGPDADAYAYVSWGPGWPESLVVRAVGGLGRDTVAGGAGDDLYLLADGQDTLVEDAGGGLDTVATSQMRYTLPDGIEQLVYMGRAWFAEGRGNGLDNLITGSLFGDALFGEGGLDRTWYPGPRAEYAVRAAGDGSFQVEHLPGREGTDRLHDLERLEFADGRVALDLGGAAGQAYRIYQAAFDRAPDAAGLGYWIAQLDAGEPLLNVATGFVASEEFAERYGVAPSDLDYIRALYLNVLDREPDAGGQAYWEAVLAGDPVLGQTSREQMLVDFSESAENRLNVIGLIADGIDYLPWGI